MLIEFADDSRNGARSGSRIADLTSRWQSSNTPATRTAVTLPPIVAICASWNGDTLPAG